MHTNPTTTPADTMPIVTTVAKFAPDAVVHIGKAGRTPGSVVTSCNGRTTSMSVVEDRPANEVTCQRCRKAITV